MADLQGLVTAVQRTRGLDAGLARRLRALVAEQEWMLQPRDDVYTGPGSLNPTIDRLEAIYRKARALREQVEEMVQRHLARSGMSEQEIERKTEETARLWQAA